MDLFDKLALWGRRYKQETVSGTERTRFSLSDLLETFDRSAIIELTTLKGQESGPTVKPDTTRKVKVSLLDDGISALHSTSDDWYEVYRMAPTGDLAWVKVIANSASGAKLGEIKMLVGRRTFDQYFEEDPIFQALAERTSGA